MYTVTVPDPQQHELVVRLPVHPPLRCKEHRRPRNLHPPYATRYTDHSCLRQRCLQLETSFTDCEKITASLVCLILHSQSIKWNQWKNVKMPRPKAVALTLAHTGKIPFKFRAPEHENHLASEEGSLLASMKMKPHFGTCEPTACRVEENSCLVAGFTSNK